MERRRVSRDKSRRSATKRSTRRKPTRSNQRKKKTESTDGRLKAVVQLLMFLIIVGVGLAAAKFFIETKPTTKRSRPARKAPLVEYIPIRKTNKTVLIKAMGTVVPSREMSLNSQLPGTVDWISSKFSPGGQITKGEPLMRLERDDYELEVRKQEALIRQLQADLDLEKGKQEVARKEIEIMKKTMGRSIKDPKLALRIPQMEKAMATLKTQQINLEQAQLNLSRTQITAPFNALILNRSIEQGSRITTQTALAKLIGTDTFWVEATVQVNDIKWIKIPGLNSQSSSRVNINLPNGSIITGRVIRLLGELSSKSQMAQILVKVDDPLGRNMRKGQLPLLLNSYVSMNFVGSRLADVVSIPRKMVKEGNRIWLFENNRLMFREIDPVWEDEKNYYISQSVAPGELLITSEISAAVHGMEVRQRDVRVAANETAEGRQKKSGRKKSKQGSQ